MLRDTTTTLTAFITRVVINLSSEGVAAFLLFYPVTVRVAAAPHAKRPPA